MTQDWKGYVARWDFVNNGGSAPFLRDLEIGYVWLMKLCKPLTLFGFFALCVAIQLFLLYWYFAHFIPKEYWWVALSVFLLNPAMCFMMVNTNRQYITVSISLVIVLILIKAYENKSLFKIRLWVLIALLYMASINIHTGAYGSLIIVAIPFLVPIVERTKFRTLFLIVNFLYFLRYFINLDIYQTFFSFQLESLDMTTYDNYVEELDNSNRASSIIIESINLLILNGSVYFFRNKEASTQFIYLMTIIWIIADGFMIRTLGRILVYLSIMLIYAIPLLVKDVRDSNLKSWLTPVYVISYLYLIFTFAKATIFGPNPFYMRWVDYHSVFFAPQWQ